MTQRPLQFGDIVTAIFPEQMPLGREQQGYRPAIVVAIPDLLDIPRFPLIVVIPLTDRSRSEMGDCLLQLVSSTLRRSCWAAFPLYCLVRSSESIGYKSSDSIPWQPIP